MATIQIKNVGPLKDTGKIQLNKLLLIIGKQSSGKSTFMKILCGLKKHLWLMKIIVPKIMV